jgi:hypothetical protein
VLSFKRRFQDVFAASIGDKNGIFHKNSDFMVVFIMPICQKVKALL